MEYSAGQEFLVGRTEQKRFHQATMFYIQTISSTTVTVRTNRKTDCAVPKFYFDSLIRSNRIVIKPKHVLVY